MAFNCGYALDDVRDAKKGFIELLKDELRSSNLKYLKGKPVNESEVERNIEHFFSEDAEEFIFDCGFDFGFDPELHRFDRCYRVSQVDRYEFPEARMFNDCESIDLTNFFESNKPVSLFQSTLF